MKRILIAVLLLAVISSPVSSVKNRAGYVSPASSGEVTIHLDAGFNMVGIPVDPGGWQLSDLINNIGDVNLIVFYDTEEDKFERFTPSTPTDSPRNIEIKEGEAYIIIMAEEKDVTFTGSPWDEDGVITLDLKKGISMVSIPPGLGTEYNAGTFCELTSATLITRYNPNNGKLEIYTPISITNGFLIEEGKGYILTMPQDKTIEISPGEMNVKNEDRYSPKQVFLVSDKDWKDVFSLVPLSVWTVPDSHSDLLWCNQLKDERGSVKNRHSNQKVCGYPLLVYNEFVPERDKIYIMSTDISAGYEDASLPSDKIKAKILETLILEEVGESTEIKLLLTNWDEEDHELKGKITLPDYFTPNEINYEGLLEAYKSVEVEEIVTLNEIPAVAHKFTSNSLDIDSTIQFLQQYKPEKVTLFVKDLDSFEGDEENGCNDRIDNDNDGTTDLEDRDCELISWIAEDRIDTQIIKDGFLSGIGGAGLKEKGQIEVTSIQNYPSYWQQHMSRTVVYVQDNYELALLASTYTSLINAPLIVEDSSLDDLGECSGNPCIFDNKKIILVGDQNWLNSFTCPDNAECDGRYTLESIQKEYIKKTNTDKLILVNPNDLEITSNTYLSGTSPRGMPEKGTGKILQTFGRTSLIAPYLASAKHELVITADIAASPKQVNCAVSRDEVAEVRNNFRTAEDGIHNSLGYFPDNHPEYLTIFASPIAIPDAILGRCAVYPTSRGVDVLFRIKYPIDDFYGTQLNFDERILQRQDIEEINALINNGDNLYIFARLDNGDLLFIRRDSNGNVMEKEMDGFEYLVVARDSENNFHLFGYRYSGFFILQYLKLNENGEVIHTDDFSEYADGTPLAILTDSNDNVYIFWRYEGKVFHRKIDRDMNPVGEDAELIEADVLAFNAIIDSNDEVHIVFLERKDQDYYLYYKRLGGTETSIEPPEGFEYDAIPGIYFPGIDLSIDSDNNIQIFFNSNDELLHSKLNAGGDVIKTHVLDNVYLSSYFFKAIVTDDDKIHIFGISSFMSGRGDYLRYNQFDYDGNGIGYERLINYAFNGKTHYPLITEDDNKISLIFLIPQWESESIFLKRYKSSDLEVDKLSAIKSHSRLGRIYAPTVTDVSSYVQRVVFYDELFRNLYPMKEFGALLVGYDPRDHYVESAVRKVEGIYDTKCYRYSLECPTCSTERCEKGIEIGNNIPIELYKNRQIFLYDGHSNWYTLAAPLQAPLSVNLFPWVNLMYMMFYGCNNGNFWDALGDENGGPLVAYSIRKGSVGTYGTVAVSITLGTYPFLDKVVENDGISLGEVNEEIIDFRLYTELTLIGDPTFRFNYPTED